MLFVRCGVLWRFLRPSFFTLSSLAMTAGFTGQQSTVPEPATLLLLGTRMSGVAAAARRRRKTRVA